MNASTAGSRKGGEFARVVVMLLVTWCLALQAYVPLRQAEMAMPMVSSAPISAAFTPVALLPASEPALPGAFMLSDSQMAQTIGAGFWSSLWEGIKEHSDEIFWGGVFILIAVLCHNGELGCFET